MGAGDEAVPGIVRSVLSPTAALEKGRGKQNERIVGKISDSGIIMLVCRDRRCIGTIGGGCMEAEVVQKAFRMMTGDGPKARVCHVDLSGTDAQEEGMVCGGTVDVLLEMV